VSARRVQAPPGKAVLLGVAIEGGETVEVAVRLVFGSDGELLRLVVPPGGPPDPRAQAARRLVARLDAELARPHAPGLLAIQREAERVAALAEVLIDLEAQHGPVVARAARLGAA
jgi:hypothetical protein